MGNLSRPASSTGSIRSDFGHRRTNRRTVRGVSTIMTRIWHRTPATPTTENGRPGAVASGRYRKVTTASLKRVVPVLEDQGRGRAPDATNASGIRCAVYVEHDRLEGNAAGRASSKPSPSREKGSKALFFALRCFLLSFPRRPLARLVSATARVRKEYHEKHQRLHPIETRSL